jgi:transcriptional regulator with XRE-family HTH domain
MAKHIRALRELAGLSQYRLAAVTGIERTRLSLFENNHIAPTVIEQAAIEKALLEEIERRSAQLLDALSA